MRFLRICLTLGVVILQMQGKEGWNILLPWLLLLAWYDPWSAVGSVIVVSILSIKLFSFSFLGIMFLFIVPVSGMLLARMFMPSIYPAAVPFHALRWWSITMACWSIQIAARWFMQGWLMPSVIIEGILFVIICGVGIRLLRTWYGKIVSQPLRYSRA